MAWPPDDVLMARLEGGVYVAATFSWFLMPVYKKAFTPAEPAWHGWQVPDEEIYNAAVQQVRQLLSMRGALTPDEARGVYIEAQRQTDLLEQLPKLDLVGGVPVNRAIENLLDLGSRMAQAACDRLNAQLQQQQQQQQVAPHTG
jgi:hypothetical protein